MTSDQMQKFVQSRINPTLQQPYFESIVNHDNDSLKYKQIRNSSMFFRTSSTPKALEGIDIDYLSMDEYDRVGGLAESSALEAMSSSPFQIVRRWSTPTTPNMQIHKLYTQSDQWYYGHRCQHCNYLNEMSYKDYNPDNLEDSGNILCVNPEGVDELTRTVQEGSYQFVCQKCGKPLDRWYNGEWTCRYPERTKGNKGIRGYFISQMNAVWISADDLKQKEMNTDSKQAFYNYTLGFPYQDLKMQVLPEDIYSNKAMLAKEQMLHRGNYKFIAAGVDWGVQNWISIHGMREGGKLELIRLFSVRRNKNPNMIESDIEQIRVEIAKYNPDIIIADTGDSGNNVMRLEQYFGEDVVFGCTFKSSPRSTGQYKPVFNENSNTVTVDKLMQVKMYVQDLKTGRISIYQKDDNDKATLLKHWQNVVIREEEDSKTEEMYQVIRRKGDDHYAIASTYARIGMTRLEDLYIKHGDTEFDSVFVNTNYNVNESDTEFYLDD